MNSLSQIYFSLFENFGEALLSVAWRCTFSRCGERLDCVNSLTLSFVQSIVIVCGVTRICASCANIHGVRCAFKKTIIGLYDCGIWICEFIFSVMFNVIVLA